MDQGETWHAGGHIVLDEDPAPPRKGHSSPALFSALSVEAKVTHLSYCWALVLEACIPFLSPNQRCQSTEGKLSVL